MKHNPKSLAVKARYEEIKHTARGHYSRERTYQRIKDEMKLEDSIEEDSSYGKFTD